MTSLLVGWRLLREAKRGHQPKLPAPLSENRHFEIGADEFFENHHALTKFQLGISNLPWYIWLEEMNDQAGHNIRFNYLYRDAGNYKVYGSVIFANPGQIGLQALDKTIRKHLISGQYFDPDEVGIPRLQHDSWNSELDHLWNEYDHIETTPQPITTNLTIDEWINNLKNYFRKTVSI